MNIVDFRSDTVTLPTPAMRAAMNGADVGDDVYGEDPSVNRLEAFAAEMMGKEAALFCPTGTQSNLVGLMAHCGRGDEYIVGAEAHTYRYEGGGAAVLGSIQPQPLPYGEGVTLPLDAIEDAIKPDDPHYARTRLICLENTKAGQCLPLDYTPKVRALANRHGLSMHLDGARLFNAAVAQGVAASELAAPFDSVSICLSKGLGAPVGSLLVASRDLIREARRWRKVLGGGMRQSGMLAAAGQYALQHHIERLADDHANAALLADLLRKKGVPVMEGSGETNMVLVALSHDQWARVQKAAAEAGIVLSPSSLQRLVTHMGVTEHDVRRLAELF